MKNFMDWFTNEESGQGMVEYGLIIALVSIVAIGALKLVGEGVDKQLKAAGNEINGAAPATN